MPGQLSTNRLFQTQKTPEMSVLGADKIILKIWTSKSKKQKSYSILTKREKNAHFLYH